jgi:hypothetical protein
MLLVAMVLLLLLLLLRELPFLRNICCLCLFSLLCECRLF